MRRLIDFSLNNKVAIWILTLLVAASGLYAGTRMKMETIPDIELPMLTVSTVFPGRTPAEVAEQITIPLEQRIKNVSHVQTISSTSMGNVSMIVIEFGYDTDMKAAEDEVRDAIAGFSLPEGAQEPEIASFNINAFPVISLSIAGNGITLDEVTQIAENEVKPELESINGVWEVQIAGQRVREVQLTFDRNKMASLGLDEETVQNLIRASAVKMPLGLFELENAEKSVVVDGNITTAEDLRALEIPIIPQKSGTTANQGQGASAGQMPGNFSNQGPAPALAAGLPTVKLADIADVRVIERVESITRTNGKDSLGLNVIKTSEANTLDVVNAVKSKADELEERFPNIELTSIYDQGKPIENAISTMMDKVLFGGIFTALVILLFLRNIRATLISVVSIPLSILLALIVLREFDITLNIMTLGAITVAIGRVVDDSIVVIENIYRRMSLKEETLKGKPLIRESAYEIFIPIMSSTLVTIAVFFPLGLVSGPVGELFMPFALTIVFSLLASLLVAITVVPMLAHILFRQGIRKKHGQEDKPGMLSSVYRRILQWALNHKAVTFVLAVVLLFGSFTLVPSIGTSFLPEEEQKYAIITYSPKPGERREEVQRKALEAEKIILGKKGIMNLQYSIGEGGPMMGFGPASRNSALFMVQYEDDFPEFKEEKEKLVRELQKRLPGGEWQDLSKTMGMVGNQFTLYVYGENLEDIQTAAEKIQDLMEEDDAFEQVETSLSKSIEQYVLSANQPMLAKLGLTASQIALELNPTRERPVLTQVEADGKTLDVVVEKEAEQYETIADMENALLDSPLGREIPVKDVVEIHKEQSPDSIVRRDGRMYAEVTAHITAKDVGQASAELERKIEKLELPAGVTVSFGGVTEQIRETFSQLGLAMVAAVAIVYFLLVVTFGGALTPFVILFSLPFTVIGALIALYLSGETISSSAMMGALMLIGIVVTNAIVLIDRVLHKEREGYTTREALLEAAGTRVRPILMTALATVGALLPLVFGFENTSGSLISRGLGVTVIGGLTSSTLLTLIVVPIVYEWLSKFRRKAA